MQRLLRSYLMEMRIRNWGFIRSRPLLGLRVFHGLAWLAIHSNFSTIVKILYVFM